MNQMESAESPEREQRPAENPAADQDAHSAFICDRCGFEMIERDCKVICPNCGSRLDCSDLTIYTD